MTVRTRTEEGRSGKFILNTVKQGDPLCATVFNLALKHVLHNIEKVDTLTRKGH